MKTLLITDLHLRNLSEGYLASQITAILQIVADEQPHDIVIMGDVFMHRRPTPTVLLEFDKLITSIKDYIPYIGEIHILRGNHDSETKADDGISALNLFEGRRVHIHEHVAGIAKGFNLEGVGAPCAFIPHYENQGFLRKILEDMPSDRVCFGHFGYSGCLNSLGDHDFNLPITCFSNSTYLGHIHKFSSHGLVTVLGTQYTTNFGEAGKENYYGVFEEGEFSLKISNYGPRHIVKYYTDKYFLESLDLPKDNLVLLRIFIDPITQKINSSKLKMDIKEKWPNVHSIEINYKSSLEGAEENEIKGKSSIMTIDEEVIKKYVKSNSTDISYDNLMSGYYKLAEKMSDTK